MSLAIPALRGTTQQALYPFKRTIKCSTLVSMTQDVFSQQRSILANPRIIFDLPYGRLNATDKNAMMALAASALGQSATNETLTLGNVTYTNLSIENDLYSGSVRAAAMWDTNLRLSQTEAQNLRPTTTLTANITNSVTLIPVATVVGFNGYITVGTETMWITFTPDGTHFNVTRGALGTTAASHTSGDVVSWGPAYSAGQAFPALPNGTRTQIPWQQNQQYKTGVSQMESGTKWTFPWWGGPIVNLPGSGLRGWVVGGDMLTDADTAVLEAHFLANWGRMFSFTFTDPETLVTYSNSYYGSDEMTIEYIEPNVNRVSYGSAGNDAGGAGGGGGGGGGVISYNAGAGSNIVSATLSFKTGLILGGGYTGIVNATLGSIYSFGAGTVIYDNTAYSGRIDTSSWNSTATTWSAAIGPLYANPNPLNLSVSFYSFGSVAGTASPPDKVLVFGAYIDVLYVSGLTIRYWAGRATTSSGSGTGTVLNAGAAVDRNMSTYAEVDQRTYGPLVFAKLTLSGFAP